MPIERHALARSWKAWLDSDLDRQGPAWLHWVWTLLFGAAIAFGFTLIGIASHAGSDLTRWLDAGLWMRWYRVNFTVSLTIVVIIHLLFMALIPAIGVARIRAFSHGQRAAFFTGVPMAGVIVGWPLGVWIVSDQVARWVRFDRPGSWIGSALIALTTSFLFFLYFNARARQAEAEKRAAEAQLRLLQGQMEPHFMFNTLATVLSLIDGDAPKAKQMLEAFVDYLRAALGKLRDGDSTLGDELAMAEAYLILMQARMGERLSFQVELDDPGLRSTAMPPLLLQPLVENAIHHGLECKVEGGQVKVSVRRAGAQVWIEVEDNGLGACEQPVRRAGRPGNGVALDNIRARLLSRYGGQAALTLELHPDAGARATLQLPFETAHA